MFSPNHGTAASIAMNRRFCYLGTDYFYLIQEASNDAAEKISIALPPEMVSIVRNAVATGEYASSSEVIRDALRDWAYKRTLRQQGIAELRQLWQEALHDKTPSIAADDVLDRLERIISGYRRCRRHGENMQLELSRFIESDLDDIANYIAQDNPRRAATFIRDIRAKFHEIRHNPLRGELVTVLSLADAGKK